MILKIQLTFPGGQAPVILYTLAELVKIGTHERLAYLWQACQALLHPPACFKHCPGRAAAAVSISVGYKEVIVDVLLLIALPAAHQGIRVQVAVVGGKEIGFRLAHAQGGDQVRQYFGTVNTAPLEGIVGMLVKLVPGQLGGHKIVYAAQLHDLRHRA